VEPFVELTGTAAPLMRPNVDTDLIIPMDRMLKHSISRQGLGPHLLAALRFRPDGSEDPGCVLNQAAYRTACILLAADNFGCGSSREPAVWTLMQYGIRCVVAPSFGGIFFTNCFKNGLLPIRLPIERVQALADAAADGPMTVSLRDRRIVTANGLQVSFPIEEFRRDMLTRGLDQVGLALTYRHDIDAFQRRDRVERPWVYEWTRG
jgi:3-isopropylmalate/(R)-2-methylmalate dehydratase small subunit